MRIRREAFLSLSVSLFMAFWFAATVAAADWSRFRGPNGTGISPDDKPVPVKWSETENLQWKVELPGPGSSCPIVVGDRVFITCWTGYGLDSRNPGDQKDLKRNLICLDRHTGKTLWSKAIDPVLPEDRYGGMFAEHGYASHTPVSDGERIFVFFGKTGVLAFDLEGNQLWQTSVGTGSDRRNWGSAASPIVYKNLVIVPAAAESNSLVALDKETGEEVWKKKADGYAGTWATPILVEVSTDQHELVVAVPYEVWGFDPETGRFLWYCEVPGSDSMCASAIAHDGIVYVLGDRGGAVAVRSGGKEDVSQTHRLWSGSARSRITTPLLFDGRIYWIGQGVANCIDAKTGERVYQSRLGGGGAASDTAQRTPPGRGGAGGRGFGGGRGGQDYSSPVAADGKMYFVSRSGVVSVVALGPEFQLLAQNRFASDRGDFSASPAISDGQLFIRSSNYLYCVSDTASASGGR